MKFLEVRFQNFGSFYGEHKFDLQDRGLLLIIGDNQDESRMDSNGAGKSWLFDAVDWCCFGDNPRGDHADAVVNEEAFVERGSKCVVAVDLVTDDGRYIEITRSRSKSKNDLKITLSGQDQSVLGTPEDRSTLDIRETQKVVNKLLGMDREVFHAAVLFAQTDLVHYADATDGPRWAILTKILNLAGIDIFLKRAKERKKINRDRAEAFHLELATLVGKLAQARPEDLDAQINQWALNRTAKVAELQGQITTKTTEYHQIEVESVELVDLQRQSDILTQELAGRQPPGEFPEGIHLANQCVELRSQLAVVASQSADLNKQHDQMTRLGIGVCSKCGQQITTQHVQNESQRLYGLLQTADSSVAHLTTQVQAVEARRDVERQRNYDAQRQFQVFREQKVQEIAALDAKIVVVSAALRRANNLAQEIDRMQAQLSEQSEAVNPWLEQKIKVEGERYELERKQGQIQYELDTLVVSDRYLDFWVKGFGPDGLKSYILDSRLQEMGDAANEWLQLLTGGTIWVRFEAQKLTRGKKLVNAPDIRVFRWNPDGSITERNYKSWCGGEKKRISFCVDFGLSRLIARRAEQTYDILMLDEVFKHLDRSGKEAVMEMIQVLNQEKSSLIVIEHDSEFQGQFDNRVLAKKQNRRSTIEELSYGIKKDQGRKEAKRKRKKKPPAKVIPGDLSGDTHIKRVPRRRPIRKPVG